MDKQIIYAVIAAILVILIPIVPKMVQLRIAVLRWLKLKKMADIHDRLFDGSVLVVRIVMFCLSGFLFFKAIGQ